MPDFRGSHRADTLIDELGPLALASRLKRLQERLFRDVRRIYGAHDVEFEPRWFLLFYALHREAPTGITRLATALSVSHAAVHQVATELEAAGLVRTRRDARDSRRRLLELTPRGRRMARILEPVWDDIRGATAQVLEDSGGNMIESLAAVERALDREELVDRVRRMRSKRLRRHVEIVDYAPRFKQAFRRLNEEWLEAYFEVEPEDRRLLADPNRRILKRGGGILFALLRGEPVGTCALIRHGPRRLELAKMAVTSHARGLGIGRMLGEAAIARARKLGADTLFLLSAEPLQTALALYRRIGFVDCETLPEAAHYKRCTISMTMNLQPSRGRRAPKSVSP